MTFHRRVRHGEYFCRVAYRDKEGQRREKWIPLKLKVDEGTAKEANALVMALSQPGAIDMESLAKTNDTLARLGLDQFDGYWKIVEGSGSGQALAISPTDGLYSDKMTSDEIRSAQLSLKAGKKVLFGDYMALYYCIHKSELQETSSGMLHSHVFAVIRPYFNQRKIALKSLQPEDLEAFYRDMAAGGKRTGNTIRHYHGSIRVALQYAFKKGYVVNNVADRVDRPKKEAFKGSFYDIREIEKLFRVSNGTNLELPIHFAVYYGLRREEVIGLKWDAIDFQYRTMTIKNTALEASVDGEHKLLLKETTKNDSSFRTMPLSQKTIDLLLEKKLKQEKMKELFGNSYNKRFDGYVNVFENGDLMRPNWVSANFRKLLDDNGMRRIRFHDLRHTCATLLRHNGVPMEDISKWLGHSNILTTERVYAHYDEAKKQDTLKEISSILDVVDEPKEPQIQNKSEQEQK